MASSEMPVLYRGSAVPKGERKKEYELILK